MVIRAEGPQKIKRERPYDPVISLLATFQKNQAEHPCVSQHSLP
jgi:hypothetical protein